MEAENWDKTVQLYVTQHAQITDCLHISDRVRYVAPVVFILMNGDVVTGMDTINISGFNKAHTIRGLKA